MIQDIFPYKLNVSFKNYKPNDNSYILNFIENKVLMEEDYGKITIPTYKTIKKIDGFKDSDLTYLFMIDDNKFYLLCNDSMAYPKKFILNDVSGLSNNSKDWMYFAVITAMHLHKWYSLNEYCGRCGEHTQNDVTERALYCPNCNTKIYPSIAPVIMVGIINDDSLLLTKYATGSFKGYSLVAGFAEIGETLEDAVRREVMEEVGLKIKNIKYYKSQPWAFSNSLIAGFYAELDGSDIVKIDEEELAEATWFKYSKIPEENSTMSLSNDMIENFRINNKNTKLTNMKKI